MTVQILLKDVVKQIKRNGNYLKELLQKLNMTLKIYTRRKYNGLKHNNSRA